MDNSPRGHRIEKISGDAQAIVQRGAHMENLGMQMRESAALLKKIEDGVQGKGYTMDEIKETVTEVHVDLARAAERYEPSGTAVRTYGEALATVQPTISSIVDNCETLWTAYQNALSAFSDADSATPPSDETPEQKTARESETGDLATTKQNAYDAWYAEASRYDTPYDTWDDAYESAVDGLQKANEDGVKDSFWDDALPAIEVLLVVLTIAGLVLAVLVLVVGGPLIALIAALVALVALGLTIWKVASGRGDKWDVIWAVVGVIPFGRLAQFGKFVTRSMPATTFLKGFVGDMFGLTGIMQLRTARNLPGVITDRRALDAIVNSRGNPVGDGMFNKIAGLGNDIADLGKYGGTYSHSLASLWSRATGGGGANLSTGMANAFDNVSTSVAAHVDGMIPNGSLLHGAQNPLSGWDQGFNLIDTVAKPGREGYSFAGDAIEFLGDQIFGSDVERWQPQLAGSR